MAISNKKAVEAAKMPVINKEARVLDVTCGSRGIWFDKNYKHTIYCSHCGQALEWRDAE